MTRSTKNIVFFVVVVGLMLPFLYFFAKSFVFWLLVGISALNMIIWFGVVLTNCFNTIRFGARMTFDEIMIESDPIRKVQLLRYHLGWSPGKIAAELNRQGVRNHDGLPWHENDVRRAVKRMF